ncbi:hypothetical protein CYY_004844 [Polysphondylium violaceum]|uniref:U3 small nucleolar RNA-associated protein 13 C-terminal domain-containing protein n=1 Tax=Polysphondylium violaceum TaxID=133409 RepID=A0A8J4PSQ7_9MYCE|nr:hypothetical protein CYY_004844 [Polysphondylium violaceum]
MSQTMNYRVVECEIPSDYEDEEQDQQPQKEVEKKPPQKRLKSLFKPEFELGSLYTGGSVVISSDSKFIAAQSGDTINIIDLELGSVISKIQNDAKITSFALSPNNEELLVGCVNLHMKQYKISDQSLIKVWRGHEGPILSIDYHVSGGLAVTGSSDRTIKVWDIEKGYCTHNFQEPDVVSNVRFHPKKLEIISVCNDLNIRIWDLMTKQCSLVLSNHLSLISGITFSNSGNELISAGRDKVLNVWDMKSTSPKKTIPIYQELNGIITLSNTHYSTLPSNSVAKLEKIKKKLLDTPQWADKVKRDDLTVVIGGEDVIRAWCVETGECIWNDQNIEFKKKDDKTQNDTPLFTFTALINNNEKMIGITSEHNLIIYNLKDLSRVGELIGYNDEVVDIKYINPENIVVATNSNEIKQYDLKTKRAQVLRGHQDLVLSVDVSNDGQFMLSGSRDKSAMLWDLNSKKPIMSLNGHTSSVTCVAMSKKQNNFAITASEDRTIKLWKLAPNESVKSGKVQKASAVLTKIAHEKDINAISIAPNDKIFATASQDSYVKIWSVNNFELLGTIKAHRRGVWGVEFSPVDQCILTCSADGTIKIWSLADFSCIKTFEGHKGSVLKASFISFGMQIVSISAEGLIKLWNIKTNECVNTFEGHDSKIWGLAVNKDQEHFITGGSDSRVIVWKDHTLIEEEREKQEEEKNILYKQNLETALRNRDYLSALRLAFILNQPQQTLSIFKQMYSDTGNDALIRENVVQLGNNEVVKCLQFIRDWNTNSKFVTISQMVLNSIITSRTPEEFSQLSTKDIPRILESLIPYSDRHFQRIDKMLQKTYLIDYTISSINPAANTLLVDELNQPVKIKSNNQKLTSKKRKAGSAQNKK